MKKVELIALLFLIIFASFLNYYHHFNYSYLFHADEWFHVAMAKMILKNEKINWYSGKEFRVGMERGWHFLLASFQKIFSLNIKQWTYIPTFFLIISILSTYVFVSRLFDKKHGIIASILTTLIPSNVTIGGPIFLVPINLSLIFIPLTLIFLFDLEKTKLNSLCVFSILTFLLYSHPPSAVALLLIISTYFLLNIFSNTKKAKRIFLIVLLSVLISLPNYVQTIKQKGVESLKFNFWIWLKEIYFIFGMPTLFFILGAYFLTNKNLESLTLVLSSIFLIFLIVLFARFKISILIPYQRIYIPLFFLMNVIASYGIIKIYEIKKIGKFLFLMLLLSSIYFCVVRNVTTPLYKLIDERDYKNFLWIKQNTPKNITAILNPMKARAFCTIAERKVYAVMPFGPSEKELKKVSLAINFLKNHCRNTTFLIENNISLVYHPLCKNENLVKIKDNIYFLSLQT